MLHHPRVEASTWGKIKKTKRKRNTKRTKRKMDTKRKTKRTTERTTERMRDIKKRKYNEINDKMIWNCNSFRFIKNFELGVDRIRVSVSTSSSSS
jgi:hypothetical protein